ncbi:hypothetical protein CgunFtcFv8_018995 [Champsocephalus gunnari]|uniref:Uncharacterized protein n=1 Tax=Champsocephalus gunnari TaxID=52237 RepID=A0AAN8DG60_CHAGU|nr:hypothetical protein CgunFtcFv8_018995 [Champsocephalus gunnari]
MEQRDRVELLLLVLLGGGCWLGEARVRHPLPVLWVMGAGGGKHDPCCSPRSQRPGETAPPTGRLRAAAAPAPPSGQSHLLLFHFDLIRSDQIR